MDEDQSVAPQDFDSTFPDQPQSFDDAFKPQEAGLVEKTLNSAATGFAGLYTAGKAAQSFVPFVSGLDDEQAHTVRQAFLQNTAVGRIMTAFGHGFSEAPSLSDDTRQAMQKAGIYNDAAAGQSHLMGNFNEAIIQPVASAVDFLNRTGAGALATIERTGQEAGFPQAGREAAAVGEYFLARGELPGASVMPKLPPQVAEARALGVIGEGEDGAMGLKEPSAADIKARSEAASDVPVETAAAPASIAPPAPDIHAVARQIAPDTFEAYDRLTADQQTLRDSLAKLRTESPQIQEQRALISSIEQDYGPQGWMTDAGNARLEEARSALEKLETTESPEMARLRETIQKNDYALRDLAPDVSKAYRGADDRIANGEPSQPAAETPPTPEVTQLVEHTEIEPAAPESSENAAEHARIITDDASSQLTAAGRPAEEAQTAAQIVAARYQARAEWFDGQKGTALDLYNSEGPVIKAGQERVSQPAMAQRMAGGIQRDVNGSYRLIKLMKSADASTFIHESGHQYLDELMRDATDPRAPHQLWADAKAVRDWLKVEDGAAIKTAQHEKFARGFERYLMEGVAPTKGLGVIFGKFKAWLTSIYQTVNKLRSPITDDIRSVFDRLLSTNPERTVVAPEREAAPGFADIHEEDARTTPPEHASAAADQIRAEQNAVIQREVSERAHEINRGTSDELSGRPAAGEEPNGVGNGPEPAAGQTGGGEEPGAIGAGGNGSAAESIGSREPAIGPGEPAGLREQSARPEPERRPGSDPAGPGERFAGSSDDLTDKAGNIVLKNLNTSEDIRQVIRDVAAENADFQSVRGPITDGQVLDLADAMGMEPSYLKSRKLGEAWTAPQIVALRKLLIQSATDLHDLMTKAGAEGASDAEVMAYAEARERHKMIQQTVSSVTAEAGRALRAFQAKFTEGMAEAKAVGDIIQDATGKTLFQLRQEAKFGARLQTPGQVSTFMQATNKPTFAKMAMEYYINSLISGPITHLRYMEGNAVTALWKALAETPSAAAIGSVREALAGKPVDRVYWGEAGAQLHGMWTGMQRGWAAAGEAWNTRVTTPLPGETVSPHFAVPQEFIPGLIGTAIRLPGRSVTMIHSFSRYVGYEQDIASQAYRQATKEGLQGKAFSDRASQLSVNPTEEMMTKAREEATNQVYMRNSDFNSFMGKLQSAVNSNIAAKFMVPFLKIGSNITRGAFVERSVLGLLSQDVRDTLTGKYGAEARDLQAGKMAVGTALAGGVVPGLMAAGLMTGGGPTDPNQRAEWIKAGYRPYSMKVGDFWVSYDRMGSLSMLMKLPADMYDTAHEWGDEDGMKIAASFFEDISKDVLDENWMRGVKDALDAIYHPTEFGKQYATGVATAFMPYSSGMGQMARLFDSSSREARTLLDSYRSRTPFLSQGLAPKRDRWGEVIPSEGSFGIAPVHAADPVDQELYRLEVYPSKVERQIRGVDLTDQQYDDYSRIAGRMSRQLVSRLVSQPGWLSQPEGVRREVLMKAIGQGREYGRSTVIMQSYGGANDIARQAIDNKKDALK